MKEEFMILVGEVEKIVLGKRVRVCACCSLSIENCACEHDQKFIDLSCIYRDSRSM